MDLLSGFVTAVRGMDLLLRLQLSDVLPDEGASLHLSALVHVKRARRRDRGSFCKTINENGVSTSSRFGGLMHPWRYDNSMT